MRAPREEAAIPFPSEEQTPPVTNISFFMGFQYPHPWGSLSTGWREWKNNYFEYRIRYMDESPSLLERGLSTLGIQGRDQVLETLLRYVREIEVWNPTMGL
jgi:hypothetical protein